MTNQVQILGTLSQHVFQYTPSGTAAFDCRIALTADMRHRMTGEVIQQPAFLAVQLRGRAAEQAQESLQTGDAVEVTGLFACRQWTAPSGVRKTWLGVSASSIRRVSHDLPIKMDQHRQGEATPRMLGGYAHVVLSGSLVALPLVKQSTGGLLVRFDLQVPETYINRTGMETIRQHQLPVTLWGEIAEQFQQSGIQGGQLLEITGHLTTSSWLDAGVRRFATTATGETVNVIGLPEAVPLPPVGQNLDLSELMLPPHWDTQAS